MIPQTESAIPIGVESVDVVSILNPTTSWVDYRKNRFGGFLRKNGISHEAITTRKPAMIEEALRACSAKVVLNEVWQIDPSSTRELCEKFPETKFVSLYHGSPTNVEYVRDWPQQHVDFLRLSRDVPNAYYGHVMDDNRFIPADGMKIVSIPNVVILPRGLSGHTRIAPADPVRILIGGRNTFIKNIGSQVAAASILKQRHGRNVIVNLLTNSDASEIKHHVDFLADYGIPCECHFWSDWSDYVRWMDVGIDITFCASLTESFGLIAAESMSLGIPVVGSFAVEFLPDGMKANPQDPRSIANIADMVISDYEVHSGMAIRVIDWVARSNEERLLTNLNALLQDA